MLNLINQNLVLSAHDVSSGGLIVALSEMSEFKNKFKNNKTKRLGNINGYFWRGSRKIYFRSFSKNISKVEKILNSLSIF